MVILITGATHTGKTKLAQRLLEKYKYPYLSIDHLKMGLIRSGITDISVEDDSKLTEFLWPIVREMVKTAIENKQNLIIEGCYIPFNWKEDFTSEYISNIQFICLCMSEDYINNNFHDIISHSSDIECRIDNSYCTRERLIRHNKYYLEGSRKYNNDYVLINDNYDLAINSILEKE